MAYADYMHCAVCDCKVHYDGEVDYSYAECRPVVLCDECLKTHEIIIKKKGFPMQTRKVVVEIKKGEVK